MGKLAPHKKPSKKDRERDVLLGLVDLYVRQGRPIGSQTLQDEGFEHLSSATIRNYFAKLEMEGYLKQHHTSGGRAPTDKAYRLYATEMLENGAREAKLHGFSPLLRKETKAIPTYLEEVAQALSDLSECAVFLSSPRFDQDFIIKIQLMQIDDGRLLCALLTDFGQVHTEIIHTPLKDLKALEAYFHYRLTGQHNPLMPDAEEAIAKQHYNEIVLRHFVNYTNMHGEEVYKAGFSKLLLYPEFHDPAILSSTLSLFENTPMIRSFLETTLEKESLQFWIGDDLKGAITPPYYASLIAIPYCIGEKPVGVIACLGPDRLSYDKVFSLLESASHTLGDNLTKSLYKFKLTYRQPKSKALSVNPETLGLTHEKNHGK